jgi:NADH-quinone oxidoreductase subunit C
MKEDRLNLIKEKLKNFNVEYADTNGLPQIIIDKKDVIEIAGILKNDGDIKFDSMLDMVSVDTFQKKNRFEVVANLFSNKYRDRMFIKVRLDSKNPVMPSLTAVWQSANWYEREAYDMMGISFEGHPDLRRIYMPEDFEHYPLRKDFPLMGIPGSLALPKK